MDELLTIATVAGLLKVSRTTVYKMIDDGDFTGVYRSPSRSQKRKQLGIPKSEFDQWIEKVGVYDPSV